MRRVDQFTHFELGVLRLVLVKVYEHVMQLAYTKIKRVGLKRVRRVVFDVVQQCLTVFNNGCLAYAPFKILAISIWVGQLF